MSDYFKEGDFVTYITPFKEERGRIKEVREDGAVFVVYHCAGEWENYENYTAARTPREDLHKGWPI